MTFANYCRCAVTSLAFAGMLGLVSGNALAADDISISDNSFYVEEAYNQEQGVVQNIFNLVPSFEHGLNGQRTINFVYTQEWPVFSQKHQLSYSIPLQRIDQTPPGGGGSDAWGLSDIFLNYRYQLFNDTEGDFIAASPRASLIFPTGSLEQGLGNGVLGYQFALPMSKTFERGAIHANVGYSKFPGSRAGVDPFLPFVGSDLDNWYMGGSAIYFMRPNFHIMLENVYNWGDSLDTAGNKSRQFESLIVPGFRWAPYTEEDNQWVLGVGLPIGLSADAPDFGVFLYMSLEQRFAKKRG